MFKTNRKDRLGNPVSLWDVLVHGKGTANEKFPHPKEILKSNRTKKILKRITNKAKKSS